MTTPTPILSGSEITIINYPPLRPPLLPLFSCTFLSYLLPSSSPSLSIPTFLQSSPFFIPVMLLPDVLSYLPATLSSLPRN